MVLVAGDKVLAVHRRLYTEDAPRFFVGEVEACAGGLARVRGESWCRDLDSGLFVHKSETRTKLLALTSGTLIVYVLPTATVLGQTEIRADAEGLLYLTDRAGLHMDLTDQLHGAAVPAALGGGFPRAWWGRPSEASG